MTNTEYIQYKYVDERKCTHTVCYYDTAKPLPWVAVFVFCGGLSVGTDKIIHIYKILGWSNKWVCVQVLCPLCELDWASADKFEMTSDIARYSR